MTCQCCGKMKSVIKGYQSKLMPNKILMCDFCRGAGHEPRYAIIIVSQSGMVDKTKPYISSNRYCGVRIEAREIL